MLTAANGRRDGRRLVAGAPRTPDLNGRPVAVVMDVDSYEEAEDALAETTA